MYGHTIHRGTLAASAIYAKAEDRQRGIHSHKTLIPTNYAKAEKQQSKKELNSSLVVVVVVAAAAAALQQAHFLRLYCCPNIKRKKIVLIFLLNIAFHFRFSFHSQTVRRRLGQHHHENGRPQFLRVRFFASPSMHVGNVLKLLILGKTLILDCSQLARSQPVVLAL